MKGQKMHLFLDRRLRFGEKKKRISCELRSMPGKIKNLAVKKTLKLEANNRFLNQ
jgi:hypothetical protein